MCQFYFAAKTKVVNSDSRAVLDVHDVAEIFKCSPEKIKRMARSGSLPAFKLGKRWYVRWDDLERYLSHKVESSSHLRRIEEEQE